MNTEKTMLQELEDINKEIEQLDTIIMTKDKRIDFLELQAKKEQLEKDIKRVEELSKWINFETGQGKYFMSLGIDKLNEKIKDLLGDKK